MRKLKLFVAACALMFGGVSASAYTVDDLTSAGWTKVTASSISDNAENYYVFVDANSSNYVMSCDATHYRPCYKTIADPVANPSFVWVLEGSGNSFALKSFSTGAYFLQADGWNTSMTGATGSQTFTFTAPDGVYKLQANGRNDYVGHWNDNGAAVADEGENIAANKAASNAPGFYLYSIPKATYAAAVVASRNTALASATKASPVEVTTWIQNADWSGDWGGWARSGSWGNQQWGQKTLESWNATNVVVKQELSGVPNGQYKLTADVISGPGATKAAYVFATGTSKVSSDVVSAEASAGNYNTMSSEVAGKTLTADNVSVIGNALTVGIDQSTGWIVADNFKLYYYGPNLAAAAALPEGGAMEAGTWYYIDVTVEGTYNLTCTTLSDIVYSTDGTILQEDASTVTTTFSDASVELSVGRYYVKSASAQTLSVAPASYSYTVGTATSSIEGSYLQSLSTMTFTFNEAASNDPAATFALVDASATASLKKDGSEVATGALSLSGTTLTATFSGLTLEMSSVYTVELPADVVGYNGQALNTAVTTTFNTPAVADGIYYMYNTDTKNYISRSGNYATQAIMDNYGLAFIVATDAENKTTLQYFDSYLWLGDDGFCYGDCNTSRMRSFKVTKVEGGYKFLNTNNSKYLAVYEGQAVADAVEGDNLKGTSNVWALESTADHVANYTKNADTQAAAAATAAGLSVTTKAALETELANNYGETAISITGAKAEKYQVYAGNSQALNEATYYSETVTGLKPGLYRLSVDAFQRAASNERVAAADGARSLIYLYAGSAKTQLKSIMDASSATAYSNDFAVGDKHYPNNEASAYTALENCDYSNVVYVYVNADEGSETGSLEIGIKNPTRLGGNFATWAVYNNWKLTYFEAKATDVEKAALAQAIAAAEVYTLGFEADEYAPYNNVAALEALATAKAIDAETASSTDVVAATAALTAATWTANSSDVECVYNGNFAIGQGSPAADIQKYGWTRTNGWGQFQNGAEGDATNGTVYYNQLGSMQYGNAGVYTMPLKANTIYNLQFKYGKWDQEVIPTVSVLNGESGMAAMAFASTDTDYKTSMTTVDMVFVTGEAGDYVLTIAGNKNLVLTGVSITKAASQVLEFADGAVPTYAPGTYPAVKITRSLTGGNWATAVYPFAVSNVNKIAVVDSYDKTTGELKFKTATASEANVPFLMRSESNATEINLVDVAVEAAAAQNAVASEVSLIGVYAETKITNAEKNYVLSQNKIFSVGEKGATIPVYRAYFQVEQPAGEGARTLSFTVDGETTAIEGVATEGQQNGAVYNLNGQRVEKVAKGLYIQNGKKVVLK